MVVPITAAVHSILLISQYPEDKESLQEFLSGLPFQLESVPSWGAAVRALRHGPFGVVVCESQLPDSSWEEVLSCLERLEGPPLLIVISRLADERLWAAVLNQCGFDVLAKPLGRCEVLRVLGHALDHVERFRKKRVIRITKYARSAGEC